MPLRAARADCGKILPLPRAAAAYIPGMTKAAMSLTTADLLIHARWIVTVETDGEVLADHALAIRDGKIVAIVPPEAWPPCRPKKPCACRAVLLMPGLVACTATPP